MIYFVGQLPPPIHGFSFANKSVLDYMVKNNLNYRIFDLTPRRLYSPIVYFFKYLALLFCEFRSVTAIYLPVSGGYRQLIEMLFVFFGLIFRIPIFVHHHSYAYLNEVKWYNRILFSLLRNSIHIVLGRDMGDLLSKIFSIPHSKIAVVSNSAYLKIPVERSIKISIDRVKIGFLSNITREKGVFLFFDALRLLLASGVQFDAYIAGPISKNIEAEFHQILREFSNVEYMGSLYNEEKNKFYSEINLFLFPTLYKNEAEPVVIWEALSAGVPVLAMNRGCIASVLIENSGWVVASQEDFCKKLVSLFENNFFIENYSLFESAARDRFLSEHSNSIIRLVQLFSDMSRFESSKGR